MPKRVSIVSPVKSVTRALGPIGKTGQGSTPLTQLQVEDSGSTVFGSVSGQRLSQSIVSWAQKKASVFRGILRRYFEASTFLVITTGAVSQDYETADNILKVPSLTQNTIITFTGTLAEDKPITLRTIPDTGGPWTLSVLANGKTKLLTRNGNGTAESELFIIGSDGTDLLHADGGGVVRSKGV